MGVELPLCVIVTLSQNAVSCFSGVKLSIRSFNLFLCPFRYIKSLISTVFSEEDFHPQALVISK